MRAVFGSTFAAGVLRVGVLTLCSLVTLAGTALLVALPVTWLTGGAVIEPVHLFLGTVCGLTFWLVLAAFHFKRVSARLIFKDRAAFVVRLTEQLNRLGYEVHRPQPDLLVSLPTFRALLLGGGLQVRLGEEDARLDGPKLFVELLRRRVRLETRLAETQNWMAPQRQRLGDRLLKRVEISIRVPAALWAELTEEVLVPLRQAGADVLCDLHLMAQSGDGIPEALVDGPVREWLREHALHADTHKDLIQWEDSAVEDSKCRTQLPDLVEADSIHAAP